MAFFNLLNQQFKKENIVHKNFGGSPQEISTFMLSPGVFNILRGKYGGIVAKGYLPEHWFDYVLPIKTSGFKFRRIELIGLLSVDEEVERLKACENNGIKHFVMYTSGESSKIWAHLPSTCLINVNPDIDFLTLKKLRQVATPDAFVINHWENLRLTGKCEWYERCFSHIPDFWQSYAEGFDLWLDRNFSNNVPDPFAWNKSWHHSTHDLVLTPENCTVDGIRVTLNGAPYISFELLCKKHYPYLTLGQEMEDFMFADGEDVLLLFPTRELRVKYIQNPILSQGVWGFNFHFIRIKILWFIKFDNQFFYI